MSNNHKWPRVVNTKELEEITAGGIDYIRTKHNEVKGLALRLDKNPDAPEAIVIGKSPKVEFRAKLFLKTGVVVPVYVKRRVNHWEYLGQYRATAIRKDAESIQKYGYTREPGNVAGVLFLECVDKLRVDISGGGFADSETRKEIEGAAVSFVRQALISEGYDVEDHQRENRGYDLLAHKGQEVILVEVKGTESTEPRFFITRNESKCADQEKNWQLFIVCQARNAPKLYRYTADQMRSNFSFDAIAWECQRTNT